VQGTAINHDAADPDAEDDDTFDLKMRLKFQKKSRSSGRRHTVANIGLPDLVGRLRRGSLSDTRLTVGVMGSGSNNGRRQQGARGTGGDGGSAATTPEYHYARKWSVDLIALADQLENPKAALLMTGAARAGSCQFNELSLRASPSPPGGIGGSGLPLGCTRAVGVRTARSSSPVAARPTLPRIIAESENVEQDSTLSPPDDAGVTLGDDASDNEKSAVEMRKNTSCMTAIAAAEVEEAPVDGNGEVITTSIAGETIGPGSETSETPSDRKETTFVGIVTKSIPDADVVTTTVDDVHVTSSADKSGGGDSDAMRHRSSSSPRDPPTAASTNGPSNSQSSSSMDAAVHIVSSDRLDNISTLPLDPPSIVVSSLNEDDGRSNTVNSDDEYCSTTTPTDGVWNALRGQPSDDHCPGRDRSSPTQSADGGTLPNRMTAVDDKSVSRIRSQLERTRRLCVMLMVSAALATPYACLLVWNSGLMAAMGESWRRQVGFNMSLAAGALLCLLFAVHAPLTVWVDRRLLARLLAMWTDLSRLRCVCYCNIGRGRNCLYPTTAADCRKAQSRGCGGSRTGLHTTDGIGHSSIL